MDEQIANMVRQRRQALHGADHGRRPWGLALSGGGIRSATFCLGLLKALAQRRQLLRFDLLSTVSGGGYIGATLGRLCTRAGSADEVRAIEGAFAQVDKVRLGWWLRANGRYLIPDGMRDTLFAAALYLRNLLGTHIEIAIAAMLTGALLATVNLLMWEAVAATVDLDNAQPVDPFVVRVTKLPTLWLALLAPWVLSIVLAQAYWAVRDRPSRLLLLRQFLMWCVSGALAWFFRAGLEAQFGAPRWLVPAFTAFAAGWVVALAGVAVCNRDGSQASALRNRLTDWLASLLMWALGLLLLGLLDVAAWWFAAHSRETRASWGGFLLAGAAALRGVLPLLFSGRREAPGLGRQWAMSLTNLAGLAVAFCLAAWWVGVFYAGVLLPVFTPAGLDFARGWVWLAILGGLVAGYALLTGRNFAFLNLSSLHMFYKARIVRGYLGAANARRLGADPLAELPALTPPEVPVGQVDSNDDMPLRDYAPQRCGGPVHLINICVNQTHDPRQRLFNRDRKSLPLTVAPQGWMQAVGTAWTQARGEGAMTLGTWTAISGAAVSPGLGRLTRRGLAALSVFAGLRLGYWWNSREAGIAPHGAGRRAGGLVRKTHFMLLECFGAFPGSNSPDWYLSDGGHFENTGAYALLQQEAQLIVIADCGADPDYRFCDIENLIRRARIDLHADIDFLRPRVDAGAGIAGVFGSLNDLASQNSQACLALAQVTYASGGTGRIVLVKPNMSAELPMDLVNFKAAHPLFPQQSTTDQSFDEAQWESYFRLGTEIGHRLEGDMLLQVADGIHGLFELDDGLPERAAPAPAASDDALDGAVSTAVTAAMAASRLQSRVLRAGAVTASLGIGTAATFGVAAWQGLEAWRTQSAEKLRAESLAFKDLTERWSRLRINAPPGEAPASLAAELLRTGDLLCRKGGENFMANFRLSVRVVDDAKAACQQELDNATRTAGDASPSRASASPACARLLDPGNGIDCLQAGRAPACVPRYWARDYTGATPPQANCSGFASGAGSMAGAIWKRLRAPFEQRWRTAGVAAPAPMEAPVAAGSLPPASRPSDAPPVIAGEGPSAGTSITPVAPSSAASSPVQVSPDACRGKLVYIQIYGAEQRDMARALRAPWRALGASVPPIEDVLASARAAGRAPPAGYGQPTIVFHDAASQPCANLMAQRAVSPQSGPWALRPLPARLRATPGTLEAWLPRPDGAWVQR